MRKLRVLMLSHAYPYLEASYAGQFVHELATSLVRLGHQVYAVVPQPSSKLHNAAMDGVQLAYYRSQDRISYGRADNAYIRAPRLTVALSLLSSVHRTFQVANRNDIDVIHAHWAIPMGFVAGVVKMMTGIPVVVTTHGRDVYVDPRAGAIVPTLWYVRPFLRFSLNCADRIIAVSQDCARHAINAGAATWKTKVVHNGVNLGRFSQSQVGVEAIRRQYSIYDQDKLILCIGTLTSYKGIDVLLRAMPYILKEEPRAVTLIVGAGPEQDNLIGLCNSLGLEGKVIWAGYVPNNELLPYENACDVFVLPSRRESFGIAAVEAMACAKPVVVTRVGGLAELVQNDKTGYLVESDNVEQLATAIVRVLGDRDVATRLGLAAHHRVETEFSWDASARKVVSLYQSLIREPAMRSEQ